MISTEWSVNCSVTPNQVKTKVYLEYAKAVGPLLSVFICFLYGCQSAAAIGANIWLSQWTNDASRNQTKENVHMRVGVYAALGIVQGKSHNRAIYEALGHFKVKHCSFVHLLLYMNSLVETFCCKLCFQV